MGLTFDITALDENSAITVISFLIIISFIILFDFFTKFLEYAFQESPRYKHMVQNIYKELMQMGIISFIFTLYQAFNSESDMYNPWVVQFDFAHIVLFFVAIWFVVHTFYLMGLSILTSNIYAKYNGKLGLCYAIYYVY